jgi:hypothetical protein
MSDFLTRLAQRQLGQIATIKPRAPELYAPVAGETAFRDIGLGSEHQPATEVDQETIAMTRESSARVPIKDPAVATDSSTGVPSMRHQPLGHDHQQRVDRPIQTEVKLGDENTPRTNNSRQFPVENSRQFPVEVSTLVSQKLSVEYRPIDLSSEAQPELPANEPSPMEKRRLVAEEKTPSPMQHLLPVRPLLVERKESDRVAAPQALYGLREPAAMPRRATLVRERTMDASEPPVQVTIGRIEVTALTAVVPPKRVPAARKPSMSLDDYLARRQRSER